MQEQEKSRTPLSLQFFLFFSHDCRAQFIVEPWKASSRQRERKIIDFVGNLWKLRYTTMEGPTIQLRTLSPDIQSSRDEQTICVGCYHKTIFPSPIAISDPLSCCATRYVHHGRRKLIFSILKAKTNRQLDRHLKWFVSWEAVEHHCPHSEFAFLP